MIDFEKAQKYCTQVESVDSEIYTKLLKLYLRVGVGKKSNSGSSSSYFKASSMAVSPTQSQASDDMLSNMKEVVLLLTTFPTKFDLREVLNLIPKITTLDELDVFLLRSYKAIVSRQRWNSVSANIRKAEDTRLAAKLVDLESRFVVVDDNRM